MSQVVDITGLDKVALLRALWEKASPASFYKSNSIPPPPFDETSASEAVLSCIDYFCGRCIKSDLSGCAVDPHLYDRDTYQGALADVVNAMKASKK
jgi:hypothetical protein